MIVDVPEFMLDGDDSIENAAALVNDDLAAAALNIGATDVVCVRPLSEVIAS
jgi:hypothetical protein